MADTHEFNLGKIKRLQNDREDLHASLTAATARRLECRSARQQIESRIQELELQGFSVNPRPGFRAMPAEVLRELEVARIEEAAANDRVHRPEAAWQALSGVLAAVEHVLRKERLELRGESVAPPMPMPDGTRPTADDVQAIRQRIKELQARDRALERSNLSEAESDRKISDWIGGRHLRLNGQPFVGQASSEFRMFSDQLVDVDVVDKVTQNANSRVVEGLLVRIAPEAIRGLLKDAAITAAESRGGWGLPSEEREALRADLDHEIFLLEVQEEQMVEHLAVHGQYVSRRRDADPLAVLLKSVPAADARREPAGTPEAPPRSAKPRPAAAPSPRQRVSRSNYL